MLQIREVLALRMRGEGQNTIVALSVKGAALSINRVGVRYRSLYGTAPAGVPLSSTGIGNIQVWIRTPAGSCLRIGAYLRHHVRMYYVYACT